MFGRIVIIGKINKRYLLPFILALAQIIYNIFSEYYPEKNICVITNLYSKSLGKIFTRLFPFILKISDNETTKEKNVKKKKCLYYILLCTFVLVDSIIHSVGELLIFWFIDKNKSFEYIMFPINDFITLSLETIFLVILSILLLNYKYYSHHIISIIIFMIFGIISDIILNNYENIDGNFFLIHFIRTIEVAIDSLVYCYGKYMMEKLYYPYWNVSFVPGIVSLLFYIIFSVSILSDSNKEKSSIDITAQFYLYFNGENIRLKIGKILIIFIFYIIMEPLIILVLLYFRPDFILIVLQFSYISQNLIQTSVDKLYCIIFFIFQFIALMIHLEILELNFCGLNENTRRNIDLRSITEFSDENRDSSVGFNYIDINKDYLINISEKNEIYIEMSK